MVDFSFGTVVLHDFLFHTDNLSVGESISSQTGTGTWSYGADESATDGTLNILHETQNTNNSFIKAEQFEWSYDDVGAKNARSHADYGLGMRGTTGGVHYGFETQETYAFTDHSVFKIYYTVKGGLVKVYNADDNGGIYFTVKNDNQWYRSILSVSEYNDQEFQLDSLSEWSSLNFSVEDGFSTGLETYDVKSFEKISAIGFYIDLDCSTVGNIFVSEASITNLESKQIPEPSLYATILGLCSLFFWVYIRRSN